MQRQLQIAGRRPRRINVSNVLHADTIRTAKMNELGVAVEGIDDPPNPGNGDPSHLRSAR